MPQDIKDNISTTFNVTKWIERWRYLGMPSMIGRKKKAF